MSVIGVPGIDAEFRIRGISSINLPTTATVLVDGMPASTGYVNSLTADRIEYIDVIKGLSKTAIFGAAGANGVIAVYTKALGGQRRENQISVNGILNSSLDGYYLAREFYTPNYLISPNNQGLPDFRPTLYWNPNVVIDQKSKAILEFYTAQKTSTYRVDV
ncbi:MAG: TonB-dependent SusC/RagA subfamily outer membrane receptor [Saprospiraceae bacterium]